MEILNRLTALEQEISEFYGTEGLTIRELVNEMLDQCEDMGEMAIEIYDLLDHLKEKAYIKI